MSKKVASAVIRPSFGSPFLTRVYKLRVRVKLRSLRNTSQLKVFATGLGSSHVDSEVVGSMGL